MDLHEIVSKLKLLASDLDKTPTILEVVAHTDISKRQINKHKYSNLCRMAGLEPNQRSQDIKPIQLEFREPKILVLDIETAPLLVRTYGLWNQNISTGFIQKDWYMLSFAAKWYGKKKMYYKDTRSTHEDDLEVSKLAHKMMCEADILVGHNVDRFDIKKLNTRFIKHDLPPIGSKQTIDTLKIAKKYFKFTSNKLDYIAKFLGLEGKRKSPKYTQQEMWNGCCDGILDCFKENKKYNEMDITVTENVFNKLKTWDENLNFQAYIGHFNCICGSKDFVKYGVRYNKTTAYQRYRCKNCGKVAQDKHNLIDKETRKNFMR